MVEDTIRTIRETEREAQEIVENARLESERIAQEAKERCGQIRGELLEKAAEEARTEAEQSRRAGEERRNNAQAGYEAEIELLRSSAAEKEKEAVDMVISLLA